MPERGAQRAEIGILAYHKIGEPPAGGWATWNYVSEAAFSDHLEAIVRRGLQVIDLHAMLERLRCPAPEAPPAVVLTFDDGYASMLTVAEPILARYGFPSVLFVPTDYIGDTNRFDHGNEPEERICTWEELRELSGRGVSIQSHGCSHRTFSDLDGAEIREEVRLSKRLLEERLQEPVHAFAFPFGDIGEPAAVAIAELEVAGYEAACLYKGGPVMSDRKSRFSLTRIPVGPDTDVDRKLGDLA